MTLRVLDEWGKIVDDDNPIVTEHNGTTGDIVTLPLTLLNDSAQHYYKNIQLNVNPSYPVSAALLVQSDPVPNYLPQKTIRRINPKETIRFNLQTSIPPNTPEQIIRRGINIQINAMRYPLF